MCPHHQGSCSAWWQKLSTCQRDALSPRPFAAIKSDCLSGMRLSPTKPFFARLDEDRNARLIGQLRDVLASSAASALGNVWQGRMAWALSRERVQHPQLLFNLNEGPHIDDVRQCVACLCSIFAGHLCQIAVNLPGAHFNCPGLSPHLERL